MTNFGAKIFGNAISALTAQQGVIANTSNNIANVNTPGYARRVLNLQTRVTQGSGSFSIGNGVEIGNINRITDSFLAGVLRGAEADNAAAGIEQEYIDRVQGMFDLTGGQITIGSALTDFYGALDDLSLNPSSIELRAEVIERTNDLVTAIRSTYEGIAELQEEANQRLSVEVQGVNSLTSQIAQLNSLISAGEGTGNTAADERDRRDQLLQQLAEKIDFDVVEVADGSITVSLSNGFPLVTGPNSRDIEISNDPSFNTGNMPPSLNGGVLNHVVYDYDTGAGQAHIDLTQILQNGGGSIGGLLRVRGFNDTANTSAFQADGSLTEIASRVEAVTQQLLTSFNQTYLGPDRDGGTAGWQPSSGDLNDAQPGVFGFFDISVGGGLVDNDADGLAGAADLTASGYDNFSSILSAVITDPRSIAAALDSGAGPPAAPSFPEGDNRNLLALSGQQSTDITFGVGNYTFTGNYNEVYNETVSRVGNISARAELNASVAQDNLVSVQARMDELSGVSLDEEFTQLVQFQKAFEASARMVRVASELLDQIVNLL